MKDNKGKVGIIVLFILLILVILGLTGYILIDKDVIKLNKEETKIENKQEIEEKPIATELDLEGTEVKNIYRDLFLANESATEEETELGFMKYDALLVKEDFFENFDLSTASESQKLVLLSIFIKNNNYEYDALHTHTDINYNAYSSETFNRISKDYFGDLSTFEHNGESDVKNCPYYTHNKEFNVYYINGVCGYTSCGEFVKITSAKELNNEITIQFTIIKGECGKATDYNSGNKYEATLKKVEDHYVLIKSEKV